MTDRLDTLVNSFGPQTGDNIAEDPPTPESEPIDMQPELPVGWRLLDPVRDGWKPTPIGVFYRS
jgi:hypothetical protein